MLKPKHPCAYPGCSALTSSQHCEAHIRKHGGSGQEGTGRWRAYSKAYLAKHPICVDPFGRHRGQIVQAAVTGHRTAHKGDKALMWDHSNHYPLCSGCNAYQCVTQEGGFGRDSKEGAVNVH